MKLTTIRSILSILATDDLHLEQLNVKTVFLHGDLEDMIQPQGYIMSDKEYLVCKLKKSLWLETSSKAVIFEVRHIYD